MTRFHLRTLLSGLADDVSYHAMNLGQGIMDIAMLLAVGLVVYASALDQPTQTVSAPQRSFGQEQTVGPQLATNCAMALLQVGCITEQVLQPQDS